MQTKSTRQILLLIVTVLVVCAVPLLFFSEQRQEFLGGLAEASMGEGNRVRAFGIILALFASDILLPIPSSAVCAVAGSLFGWTVGTIVCWVGLNISAGIGYWLGRLLGWNAVKRFSDEQNVLAVKNQVDQWGVWPLIAFRPLPVLAEASILLMGTYRYPQSRFWPPIVFANVIVAGTFVALGIWFAKKEMFGVGLVVACAIPIIGLAIWTWLAKPGETEVASASKPCSGCAESDS